MRYLLITVGIILCLPGAFKMVLDPQPNADGMFTLGATALMIGLATCEIIAAIRERPPREPEKKGTEGKRAIVDPE